MILHTLMILQTILTLSESYYQTRVNTFSEFISNITDTFRELLLNNTTHFSRHKAILTFPESYWQTILHTLPELPPNSTDIFRGLLVNNTTRFSRVNISSNTDIFREFLPN